MPNFAGHVVVCGRVSVASKVNEHQPGKVQKREVQFAQKAVGIYLTAKTLYIHHQNCIKCVCLT